MKARIRELIRIVPFQPFTIQMADGRKFRVDHPDSVFASPKNQSWVIVIEEKEDRWHHLSPTLITGVERIPDTAIAS